MAMAGPEVVSLALNVMNIVETVIKLLAALRDAQRRQSDLPQVLRDHQRMLQDTREIVEIILSEDALQIGTIIADLNNIDTCGNDLRDKLVEISMASTGKNAFQQYTYQLLRGSKDTTSLSDMMKRLNLSKDSLVLKIQVVHVGLTKAYGSAIQGLSSLLEQTPGAGQLRLAEFPKNGKVGNVPAGGKLVYIEFTNVESMEICGEVDVSLAMAEGRGVKGVARSVITRDVIGNKSRNTAFMLNGPVGKEQAKHLTIRDNEASEESFMLNHGTKWKDIKRLKRMQQGVLDSSDSGAEDDPEKEDRRRRKRARKGKSPARAPPRGNGFPQPQEA